MGEFKTKEQMKAEAIKYLKQLGIYKPYIKGFEEDNKVCFFENFGGYWLYQEEEIANKVKIFEEEYGCLVYAVTHEFTSFGEMWDFLYVSKYVEDGENFVYSKGNHRFIVDVYVWNKTDDMCSEFGSIEVQSFGGGIRRIG